MVFKKHQCKLGLGSDSMLAVDGGLGARLCRRFRKFGQISPHHPQTFERFYSSPAMMAERQRHLYEGGRFLIHPFSLCSLTWMTIMVIVNVAHICISFFRLSYIILPLKDGRHDIHFVDWIMLALDIICWIDILFKFNTGYVVGKRTNIVLDRRMIAWRYLIRWFAIDLVSCLPVALCILLWYPHKSRYLLVALVMPLLRCARLHTAIVDMDIVLKSVTKSHIWSGVARHVLIFLVTCHWCSCFIFLPPIFSIYWYGEASPKYANFLTDGRNYPTALNHFSVTDRYKKSIFVSLSTFFGTGFSLFHATLHDEILLHTLVIFYAAMFMVYTFVFLLKIYLTIYSSNIRYYALTNQVEEYMRHKQFPLALKKRVRAFYYYRYQEIYFNEENVLNSLSEGLRNEITLHTCSKLVEKVALFRDVPAPVMGSILGCLQPEVYMPNEFVFRAGEIGDYMYFVANGTVAVYSLKGAEVCHLEDGAYFGEVALLMKDSKRVATVIAIEITLLYKLEIDDFKQFIMSNELLYERVEALASRRMHETVLMDKDVILERTKDSASSSGLSINTKL